MYVRTFVSNNDKVVCGTRWDVRYLDPEGKPVSLAVFDDGNHADGKAGDGISVGAIVAGGLEGTSQLRAEGHTPKGGDYVATGLIEVQPQGDLALIDSITVSPATPKVGQVVTLTVTAANKGALEFNNVALECYVDMVKISEQQVSLRAGESKRISTKWMPSRQGKRAVQLTLMSDDEPYWSDFKNNSRKVAITVR